MKIRNFIITAIAVISSLTSTAQVNQKKIDSLLTQAKKHINNNDTSALHRTLSFIELQKPNASDIGVFFNKNGQRINQVMGKDYVLYQMRGAIDREFILPLLQNTESKPHWQQLELQLKAKYPESYEQPYLLGKFNFASKHRDFKMMAQTGERARKLYPEIFSPFLLNNLAFNEIFRNSKEKKTLEIALGWSAHVISKTPNVATYHDTYANILYKLGKKQEALKAMQTAIDLSAPGEAKEFTDNLEKIQRGLPTW